MSEEQMKHFSTGMEILRENVSLVISHGNPEDLESNIEELRAITKDYITKQKKFEVSMEAVRNVSAAVKKKIENGENQIDVQELFTTFLDEEKYRVDVEKHEAMVKFREAVKSGMNKDEGQEGQEVRDEDQNEELAMINYTQSTIDPFMKREMTDPVKNKICGHVYEKSSVMEFIKRSNTRCPTAGCSNPHFILKKHLEEDSELKNFIHRKMKKSNKNTKST